MKRHHSPTIKQSAKVVLKIGREQKTIAQLALEYGIHPTCSSSGVMQHLPPCLPTLLTSMLPHCCYRTSSRCPCNPSSLW
jgi:hypothetical protein